MDGVYENFNDMSEKPQSTVNASVLNGISATCVDACLPSFLLEKNQTCTILNGYDVKSVRDFVDDATEKGTIIYPQ